MSRGHIILGIDPGTILMGYGILEVRGNHAQMMALGVLKLDRYANQYTRLRKIFEGVNALIARYEPNELSIEAPFYGKNVQSMLKLGRAQGAAITAALTHDLPVTEYFPMVIKRAITGNGHASKEQVADMLQKMLKIAPENMLPQLDATDGLAAAYCHFLHSSAVIPHSSSSSWKEFIRNNPGKVKGL